MQYALGGLLAVCFLRHQLLFALNASCLLFTPPRSYHAAFVINYQTVMLSPCTGVGKTALSSPIVIVFQSSSAPGTLPTNDSSTRKVARHHLELKPRPHMQEPHHAYGEHVTIACAPRHNELAGLHHIHHLVPSALLADANLLLAPDVHAIIIHFHRGACETALGRMHPQQTAQLYAVRATSLYAAIAAARNAVRTKLLRDVAAEARCAGDKIHILSTLFCNISASELRDVSA